MESQLALQLADVRALVAAAHREADRHPSAAGSPGPVTVAVVDGGGHLLALERRDGASPASAQTALAKARMAALNGKATADQELAINGERPALLQLASLLDGPAAAMGGGLPLLARGHCLGAIGVSGLTPQEDLAIATAGQAALEHLLPSPAVLASPAALPRLLAVGLSTADAEAAARFYGQRLGFQRRRCEELVGGSYGALIGLPQARLKRLVMELGEETLELWQVLDPGPGQRPGRAIASDSRSCDLWFQHICIVVADLDAALHQLHADLGPQVAAASPISRGPQTLPAWNPGAAGIQAYKFRDPEGHCLELLQFPADKGEARWHQRAAQASPASPWLGIDHSAIAVADSERSQRFYNGLLGLRAGGDGVNSGVEQDGLDGLSHTQVRISSHRCPLGPGVEALAYQPPNTGRPQAADLAPQDLAHWQLRLALTDLNPVRQQLEAHGGRLLGEGQLDDVTAEQLGLPAAGAALQVADPDGHRLQLVQLPPSAAN